MIDKRMILLENAIGAFCGLSLARLLKLGGIDTDFMVKFVLCTCIGHFICLAILAHKET